MADKEVDLDALKIRLLGLRASLDRDAWTDVLSKSVAAIVVEFESGYIVDSTPTADEMFGYIEGELVGKPLDVLIPDNLKSSHVAHLAQYSANPTKRTMGSQSSLEIMGKKRDGSGINLVISLWPRMVENSRCAVAIIAERF